MRQSVRAMLLTIAALAGGCIPPNFLNSERGDTGAASVQSPLFASPAPTLGRLTSLPKSAPSSPEIALAVDRIGNRVVDANNSIGLRPAFSTIGTMQPEIFHHGTSAVFVTEGMVRQCKTEGQLAAILSIELARMIAEREVLATPEMRNPEKRPPIAVEMGNAGQFNGLDQLRQEEIAKLGAADRRPSKKFVPPDPMLLARNYLEAAGFDKKELEGVAPLLYQAEKNYILEKQFKTSSEGLSWMPQ